RQRREGIMIRAKELDGRAVIDMGSAQKLGYVDEIFLDPAGGRVSAFQISTGSTLMGGRRQMLVPPSAIESIGLEALMRRSGAAGDLTERRLADGLTDSYPRLSHLTGRKVVTQSGNLLGAIGDVLIDGPESRIVGYELRDPSWTGALSSALDPGN